MRTPSIELFVALLAFSIGTLSQKVFVFRETLTVQNAAAKLQSTKVSKINTDDAPPSNPKKQLNQADTKGFYGWFKASDFGKMKEVWTILLNKDYEDSDNKKTAWSAMVLTDKENDNFESVSINTNNNALSFKTRKIKGVEYKFEGVFFKGKKSGADGEEVLKGSLRKFVKGKQVAVVNANFAYYEPHCRH